MKIYSLLIVPLLGLAVWASPANAQISAVTFTGGTANGTTAAYSNYNWGYSFTANTDGIVVDDLSVYDVGGDGLAESHDVGIWQGTTLIGTVTIDAGTVDSIQDGFRYKALSTPITLIKGQTYTVGANFATTADKFALYCTNATYYSGITLTSYQMIGVAASGATLTEPTNKFGGDGTQGDFGGSFIVASVPEPQTYAMVGVGLLSLLGFRKFRGQRCGA